VYRQDPIVDDYVNTHPNPIQASTTIKKMLHAAKPRGNSKKGFGGLQPVKAKLWSNVNTNATSANSALAVNNTVTLNASTFPELTNWGLVYDEMRCLNITLHWTAVPTTLGSVANVAIASAIEFDPNTGAPNSVNGVMESTYNSGIHYLSNSAPTLPIYPAKKYSAKTPGPLMPITSSDCPGNGWITLETATNPAMCVVSAYGPTLGTSGVYQFQYFVELDVEFRMRT
jgi:hypothetical protein